VIPEKKHDGKSKSAEGDTDEDAAAAKQKHDDDAKRKHSTTSDAAETAGDEEKHDKGVSKEKDKTDDTSGDSSSKADDKGDSDGNSRDDSGKSRRQMMTTDPRRRAAAAIMTPSRKTTVRSPSTKGLSTPVQSPLGALSLDLPAGLQELFLGGTGMGPTGCPAVAEMLETSKTILVHEPITSSTRAHKELSDIRIAAETVASTGLQYILSSIQVLRRSG